MDVRPLHNEQDYDWAIREVACYFEKMLRDSFAETNGRAGSGRR